MLLQERNVVESECVKLNYFLSTKIAVSDNTLSINHDTIRSTRNSENFEYASPER